MPARTIPSGARFMAKTLAFAPKDERDWMPWCLSYRPGEDVDDT